MNLTAFKILLDAGVKISDENGYSSMLFDTAIFREKYDIAQYILDINPSTPLNKEVVQDDEKEVYLYSSSLAEVASEGNLEWVNKLIQLGAKLTGAGDFNPPIYGAALNGHKHVVKALIEAGSESNPTLAGNQETLFDVLTELENVEMIEFIEGLDAIK